MRNFSVNWNAIRPLNGSQRAGFEELCCQLADYEVRAGVHIRRIGNPDGGVEGYAALSNDTEWGWQAKYFSPLGNSQWSQLDKSVNTALEKHPRLVRYYICIPMDRADPRVEGRSSMMKRWDDHVQKWTRWATARNMAVEFVYWGSHELLTRLADPKHVGRVRFFFDARAFDTAWFSARLTEAVDSAGPRYTPKVHVDLPIKKEFEGFGRTTHFFNDLKARARGLRDKLGWLVLGITANETSDFYTALLGVKALTELILSDLGNLAPEPIDALPFRKIGEAAGSAAAAVGELMDLIERENESNENRRGEANVRSSERSSDSVRERWQRALVLHSELSGIRDLLVHADSFTSGTLLLLSGDAGTGKTHLLCDIATKRLLEGRPTILLMGQRFLSVDEPWIQALQQLDLSSLTVEEFIGALEAAAQAAGCRALIMIDALNEGAGRRIWPAHLSAFLSRVERSPWIGVVIAVRSSYEQVVVPAEIRQRAFNLEHVGFAGYEYDATLTFFTHYSIEMPSTPLLIPEFRNPFFLKVLCVGLSEMGHTRLPRGCRGISLIFDLFFSAINDRLSKELNFNPKNNLVRRAVESLAELFIEVGERWLPVSQAGARCKCSTTRSRL